MARHHSEKLQKAIDLVTKATKEDNKRNYEQALYLYDLGVGHLQHVMEYEVHTDAAKEAIRTKCVSYCRRAEKIRSYLDKDRMTPMKHQTYRATRLLEARVEWNDVAGLDAAKEALKEAVILPIMFPRLFIGIRRPYRGVLLFGPPGTGKSHLAKALATEMENCAFVSVSPIDIMSRDMGGSGKSIEHLFSVARENKPAVIFVDEVDLLATYEDTKTEFKMQLEEFNYDTDGVIVLATTSSPWKLDSAILKRFEKRIYIPLPEAPARSDMLKLSIGDTPHELTPRNFHQLGTMTEGYSGADIHRLVRDAFMQPVRKIQTATHFRKVLTLSPGNPRHHDLYEPCAPRANGAIEMTFKDISSEKVMEPRVSMVDFRRSLLSVQPEVNAEDSARMQTFIDDHVGLDEAASYHSYSQETVNALRTGAPCLEREQVNGPESVCSTCRHVTGPATATEVSPPVDDKRLPAGQCQKCQRDLHGRCSTCLQFLCTQCFATSDCMQAAVDTRHVPVDMVYVMLELDYVLSMWAAHPSAVSDEGDVEYKAAMVDAVHRQTNLVKRILLAERITNTSVTGQTRLPEASRRAHSKQKNKSGVRAKSVRGEKKHQTMRSSPPTYKPTSETKRISTRVEYSSPDQDAIADAPLQVKVISTFKKMGRRECIDAIEGEVVNVITRDAGNGWTKIENGRGSGLVSTSCLNVPERFAVSETADLQKTTETFM